MEKLLSTLQKHLKGVTITEGIDVARRAKSKPKELLTENKNRHNLKTEQPPKDGFRTALENPFSEKSNLRGNNKHYYLYCQ